MGGGSGGASQESRETGKALFYIYKALKGI
jgi:hypothetical protein